MIAGKYLNVIRGIEAECDIHTILHNDRGHSGDGGGGGRGGILGLASHIYTEDDDTTTTTNNTNNSTTTSNIDLGPFLGENRTKLKFDLNRPGELDTCVRHCYRYSSRALLKLLG